MFDAYANEIHVDSSLRTATEMASIFGLIICIGKCGGINILLLSFISFSPCGINQLDEN